MYKKSSFNVVVEILENGNKLVFNTMSCVLGIMNSETQDIYENVENIKHSDIENTSFQTLLKNGFVIPITYNEHDVLKTKDMMRRYTVSNNVLGVTVATSLNCNMACTYCYESRTDIDKKDMGEAVQADVVG